MALLWLQYSPLLCARVCLVFACQGSWIPSQDFIVFFKEPEQPCHFNSPTNFKHKPHIQAVKWDTSTFVKNLTWLSNLKFGSISIQPASE